MPELIRMGTRGSDLARWQTDYVADLLRQQYPDIEIEIIVISTQGDRIIDRALPAIGGKGLFTMELEEALHNGEIDCAVHSLKDLPTENTPGLIVGAVPKRAPVEDVLISRSGKKLLNLKPRATIGTSSRRRAAQLLYARPDLKIVDIRGNVPTRINRTLDPDGPYDATVLARAGLERLGLMDKVSEIFSTGMMMPAPGQGALGIQCRDDEKSRRILAPLNHIDTQIMVTAERAFLNTLEGGCSVPVGAFAHKRRNGQLVLNGRVVSVDGTLKIESDTDGDWTLESAAAMGQALAVALLRGGAGEILAEVRS